MVVTICCCDKHHDRKQLGVGKGLFQFIDYNLLSGEVRAGAQERNLAAGTVAETVEE